MKLLFLGTGSAFVPIEDNYQSNMMLRHPNGKNLLIDCGSDIRHSLAHFGFSYTDINAVYISHQHADHCGGLEWLALTRKFSASKLPKPELIIHPNLLKPLWENTLSGGLETLSGPHAVQINDFFSVRLSDSDNHVNWEGIDIEIIVVQHFYNGIQLKPSFGLFINTLQTKVLITGDTKFTPALLMPYYLKADIIFHDCNTAQHSEVHANFNELATLPYRIKAKMWLYHYPSFNTCNAIDEGFMGFVKKGQVFEV